MTSLQWHTDGLVLFYIAGPLIMETEDSLRGEADEDEDDNGTGKRKEDSRIALKHSTVRQSGFGRHFVSLLPVPALRSTGSLPFNPLHRSFFSFFHSPYFSFFFFF
jgi:hypothetical protein